MKDRYSAAVGLLFAAVIVIAFLNTIGNEDEGILGLNKVSENWPLPEFAVPIASGKLEGDANVAQDDCETSQAPCPDDARRTPACRIESPRAVRICDFFDRPLVLSFWFAQGGNCVNQQDAVDEAYARYGERVGFLSLNVRDDRGEVRDLVQEQGWEMPVGYDRDGAVASLYRVGGCPTIAYVYPGGTLQSSSARELTRDQLEERIRGLLSATRKAEGG